MNAVNTLLIDLDDTTYPPSIGIWPVLTERIFQYMHDVVKLPAEIIPETRDRLFEQYGTTMIGLNKEYGIAVEDYLDYVHSVDLSDYLKPNDALREALISLPQEKWIFTNASRQHASNVLGLLGIDDLFMGVIDVLNTEPWCKPYPEAFEIALKLSGNPVPAETLFVDDLETNLNAARKLGIQTLRVSNEPVESSHPVIEQLADLPGFLAKNTLNRIEEFSR